MGGGVDPSPSLPSPVFSSSSSCFIFFGPYFAEATVIPPEVVLRKSYLWNLRHGAMGLDAGSIPSLALWVKGSGCCHRCGIGHNCGWDLIPGPGTPYAMGWPKRKKKKILPSHLWSSEARRHGAITPPLIAVQSFERTRTVLEKPLWSSWKYLKSISLKTGLPGDFSLHSRQLKVYQWYPLPNYKW